MTTCAPAGTHGKAGGVVAAADVDVAARARSLDLGVATETKISIRLEEQFGVDGSVRIVADRAAFAHGRMLINIWLGLFPVALGTEFIQPRHRQAARRFHDVHAVGIVALDAVHFSLQDRMMLGKMKFGIHFHMTLQTGLRVLAWIDDEFIEPAPAAHRDVFAARSMAGFATVLAGHPAARQSQSRVRAGGKYPGDLVVAIRAGFVAHKRCAFDLQRRNHRAVNRGT